MKRGGSVDLIYTNENRKDIGILQCLSVDIAFGKSENDFQLDCDSEEPMLHEGYYVYYEGTEYGGVIDSIGSNSEKHTVRYTGRTWHGILDSKIIEPPAYRDYLILDGEVHDVINELLEMVQLDSLFTVSDTVSDFEVNKYQVPRYWGLYQVLNHMLASVGARLNIEYVDGEIILSALPLVDYSKDEEWDTSQFKLYVEKGYKPVNHLICLGSGELAQRAVIHLFTDANGGIMPYATVDEPIKDSQYILDKSNQQFFGQDDRSEVFDYNSAQTIETYEQLTTEPNNWEGTYFRYYKQVDEETQSYEQLERNYGNEYNLLDSESSDWLSNYGSYYYLKSGEYVRVSEDLTRVSYTYPIISHKPKDWEKNYSDYYYRYSQGLEVEWRSIPAVNYNDYKKQTMRPTDWGSNKGNYYVKETEKTYEYKFQRKYNGVWKTWTKSFNYKIKEQKTSDSSITLIKSYVSKITYTKIKEFADKNKISMAEFNDWKKSKYRPFYTQISKKKAPKFTSYEVRQKHANIHAPQFTSRDFYERVSSEVIPVFVAGLYYDLVQDRYADLVSHGIERLTELWSSDKIDITFTTGDAEYYVNDIVGASDDVLKIKASASITKKIFRVNQGRISIQYQVG